MDIDFENLTDEAKTALKDNLSKIEEATGTTAFDTSKPLERSDMEQLQISHKMDGEQKEMSIWDTVQMASKGVAYDKHQRANGENAKVVEAMKTFTDIESLDDMPDDATLEIVARTMGTTKDNLVASLEALYAPEDKSAPKAKDKPVEKSGIDYDSPEFKKAVVAAAKELMPDNLVQTKFHGAFLNAGMKKQADEALAEEIQKVIKVDPRLAKLAEAAGDNEQRKGVLDIVTKMLTSTVDKQARGRITEIAAAGKGDIVEEIPNIVKELVEIIDPSELLSKVTPQAITFAGGEPGDAAIKILSSDKPEQVSMAEPEAYEDQLAANIGRKLAEVQMSGT